ncbi:GNAT family N-acetyltransferase [Rhodanobacter sp. AS-Z3]|uniref:GNAT family N-acetyltransferase n=1 Tax=Rhodanobacter sp. AS-Z3 TaxID=3031330 RepID=UPI00247AB5A7|nr:GNAT family N-acetyltransferase [Rhodanobacter sp. AS-Z3]WEN13537.1 GNAT family N-acetyltransferase [Rhodanobacter sp. AS-Z3]
MKLQDFHIEVADWSNPDQRSALLDLRETVFIHEQGVPEQRERDGLDGECWHVLARDEQGRPIGCGRLTPAHKIGRMAVLKDWRGRGVGAAVLRELIARARSQGWPEVALDAQVSAMGFYEQAGFVAYGEEFEDAGLQHRGMRMALPRVDDEPTPPLRDIGMLAAATRSETAAARLQLLVDTRHQLNIYLPLLGNDAYASTDELAELRRIAISGRGAQIRIILHDPAAALRNDHRLIALAQRLPSAFQIRTPVEEADLAYISAYLLNDAGGYLFLPEADRAQGRAARCDRANQVPLQQHFDEVWDRAERASELQSLNI